MERTCVVVPCFNEERRLDIGSFEVVAQEHPVQFLFVDDGSTDDTAHLISAVANGSSIALHRLERNSGKAEAVRVGLRRALQQGDVSWVGYIDADGAVPLSELTRIIEIARTTDAQVLLGSRVRMLGHSIRRRAARHYVGRVFATLASAVLELPIYDTQCGLKLFKNTPALHESLEREFRSRWIFDVELLGRLLFAVSSPLAKSDFLEVPLLAWEDKAGSKIKTSDGIEAFVLLAALAVEFRK